MSVEKQDPNRSWIEIARVGTFADSKGVKHNFSKERLCGMAAGYDSHYREAPLVFGHPATNGPAHGWIKNLKVRDDKLLAETACVSEQVKKAVDNKEYRYVSMSLYPDGGLRHVGLLGATPPAIDGLAPLSFSDEADVIINFNDGPEPPQEGEQMNPDELLKQVSELREQLAALTKERDEARAALAQSQAETEKTAAEFAAFQSEKALELVQGRLDKASQDGKLMPAEMDRAKRIVKSLFPVSLNFSSADGESPLEAYLTSLETREPSPLAQNFSAPEAGGQGGAAYEPISAKL